MRTVHGVSCVAALLLLSAVPAWGQQARITNQDELNAAVVERADARERERAQLKELLQRPEVRDVAQQRGLDLGRVQAAAGALDANDLRVVNPLVQSITAELAGGQVISINATTLIIILLIVILIIVAT